MQSSGSGQQAELSKTRSHPTRPLVARPQNKNTAKSRVVSWDSASPSARPRNCPPQQYGSRELKSVNKNKQNGYSRKAGGLQFEGSDGGEEFALTSRRPSRGAVNKRARKDFVQANCQLGFLHDMPKAGEEPVWSQVRLVSQHGPLADCPICLAPPRPARITRCGHVYCVHCLLQMMTKLAESGCAVCHEVLFYSDMKRVQVLGARPVVPQTDYTVVLMRSSKHSGDVAAVDVAVVPSPAVFSRFTRLSVRCTAELAQADRITLECLQLEAEFSEVPFIDEAIVQIEKELDELNTFIETEGSGGPADEGAVTDGESVYFYQAPDGQHIFLHPFNVTCLLHEYGSLDRCPAALTGRVVSTELVAVSAEVKRRFTWTSHLADDCELTLVELALRPPHLSPDTLRVFSDQIDARRRTRRAKQRAEKLYSREPVSLAEDLLSSCGDLISREDFFRPRTEIDVAAVMGACPALNDGEPGATLDWGPVSPVATEGRAAPLSFARVMCTPVVAWPQLAPVPGRPAATPTVVRVGSSVEAGGDDVPAEFAAPDFGDSFANSLAASLSLVTQAPAQPAQVGKKKKKRQVLFST